MEDNEELLFEKLIEEERSTKTINALKGIETAVFQSTAVCELLNVQNVTLSKIEKSIKANDIRSILAEVKSSIIALQKDEKVEKDWEFTVTRDRNGLIDKVKAKQI